jgi:hypothetical protein
MKYPTRIYYTETDKAEMWDRWQKGESLNSIARHFGRGHSSIQGLLARTGGIRPPQRTRSRSTSDRLRPRTEPYRVTGKVISCSAVTTARSRQRDG